MKISNLNAYYDKSHILHGVNLTIGKGEIVALLGRNGSGRSTLATKSPKSKHCATPPY